jgi:hypothetical protein
VRLNDDHPVFAGSASGGHRTSEGALAVCFRAHGKHTYLVRPAYAGREWRPEVVDENVTGVIVTKATSAVAPDCSPEAPRVLPNSAPAASKDEAVPGPTAADAGSAAAGPEASTVSNAADAGMAATDDDAPAPPPPPPRAVRPATDREVPRVRPRRPAYGRAAAPPPPPAHPGSGIGLELGLAFGGDELASAQLSNGNTEKLHAGDGLLVALVGAWTPLWLGDGLGLGLGVSVGWKYGDVSASNGSVSLSRFPFSAFVQILPRLDGRWFFVLRGGVTEEQGATLSGSGVASIPDVGFASRPGGFGDVGAYRAFASGAGLLWVARYTNEKLVLDGQSFDASSIGVAFGIYFGN